MLELVLKRGGYQPWRVDEQIAQAVGVGTATVERVRKCFVLHGLTVSLTRKNPDRTYLRRLDGKAEAQLIALACGSAPEGRTRWTLRLLADRLVELEIVDAISYEAVRRTLNMKEPLMSSVPWCAWMRPPSSW